MGAICMVVCMAFLAIVSFCLSIAEIVMGAMYFNRCPIEHYIPIYLVVSGGVGVILALTNGSDAHKTHKKSRDASANEGGESDRLQGGMEEMNQQSAGEKCWSGIRSLLTLFAFIWMIIGMYWVLHVRGNVSADSSSSQYCNPNLYLFALVMVFIRLALIVATLVVAVCVCCGLVCCAVCMA
ncbi:hypothetical protein BOX15_Mlig005099g2 [Macrostomum lignano]|uniref:Uncharacterized protein n=1 Tax=Macrostomum lignano TaxID=282301 RepID=A0A267FCB6_9PLAT|nr:hypothetical protein BOX15_Mlig005099g1 [Macrostomum lignano]PAA77434.1 hypothetical protein BOX15_Mlig005099g3 [Macrostomum lignano]PAA88610.1 hypothetical protein BOX15_Mlig005099g2 [Macrostomum lignano]